MNLNLENLKKMFSAATAEISARENELSALDAVCGDGDHGSAVKGAMRAANDAVSKASNLKAAFFDAGFAAMSHSNGSTSTLFGSFFMGISDGIKAGAQELGGEELGTAFESGLSSLRSNTKADIGDKTLMDALVPAVAAMRGSKSVESAFSAAAEPRKKGQKAPNVWLLNLEGLKILGKICWEFGRRSGFNIDYF
ncbi:MAG: DAK2 domain-containing protein [Bacilli bacterium]